MALYTKESIERLKDALDIVELVGGKTDLRRVGSRWVGLCPFHDERTPSFSVNAEEKLYYCFGCGASGDAIGFVRETEALEFREAVELLAERSRVELELEREDPREEQRRRRRERLLALLERSARYYAAYLWDSAEARKARGYLAGRGLGEEVLRDFRVGYSPSAWDRVVLGAQRDGFTEEELRAAGLAQQGRTGGCYDRFRGRIMFPLADGRGRVLGFGARAMGEGRGPKYLNTSENDLYRKGRQLFGLDRARGPAAKAGWVVVVEGYTDVLALHQAGVREAVAIMGTALTREQLAELARTAPTIYLALDADRSGQDAMLRAAGQATAELRVVDMPKGEDPADVIPREGAEGFRARLDKALSVREFQVHRVLVDADLDSPGGRDRALKEAQALIAGTSTEPALRDHLVRKVSDRLDVSAVDVLVGLRDERSASAPHGRAEGSGSRDRPADPQIGATSLAAERAFLAICARSGELGRQYLARLGDRHLSSEPLRRARDHLERHLDDPLAELPKDDPVLAQLLTDIAMAAGEEQPVAEPVLRISFLQLESRRIQRELRHAAQGGDLARQDQLAEDRQAVRREMDAAMAEIA